MNNHGQPYVRVSARDGTGLGLVAPARARQWLRTGKARMVQRTPCHVRLTCPHAQATRQRHFAREAPAVVGVDPGYETTGIIARIGAEVIFALEVEHRTKTITVRMTKRASLRKGRRSRRAKRQRDRGLPPKEARFDNRRRDEGWLPPSLRHLRDSTVQWVRWLVDAFDTRVCVVVESALFDPHLLREPEVSGEGYQEGPLYRSHLYRALAERDGHQCVYCGRRDGPFECEHVVPKARGGSDAITNRVLACRRCNDAKKTRDVREFLHNRPKRLASVLENLGRPLRAATAMNVVGRRIVESIEAAGIQVSKTTGADTADTRRRLGLAKSHCADALGASWTDEKGVPHVRCTHPVRVHVTGRGPRQAVRSDRFGFPARKNDGEVVAPRRGPRPCGVGCGDRVAPATSKGRRGLVVGARSSGRTTVLVHTGKKVGTQVQHLKVIEHRGGHQATPSRTADEGLASISLATPTTSTHT